MPRRLLAVLATAGALAASAPASHASVTCPPVGPVPGYGPVCTVTCAAQVASRVKYLDPKDPKGILPPCTNQD
jgi:hypothetical protein